MARGEKNATLIPAGKTSTLTAAAARVNLSDKKIAVKQIKTARGWQIDSFAYCKSVPELKHGQIYVGNAMSKLRLFAAFRPNDTSDPVALDSEGVPAPVSSVAMQAQAELSRLRGEVGGTAAILKRMGMNLDSVGEGYLVGWAERPATPTTPAVPETWQWCSILEVQKKAGKWVVIDGPDDKTGREITEQDTMIRIWEQDAEYASLADCAMQGVLGEAKILQVLSQQVLAQAMRAASNGFFVISNEMSFGAAEETEPEDGEEAPADPLLEAMDKVFMGPLEDPSDPNSVQPAILRGPSEHIDPDHLRHITFWSKDVDDALEEKIAARVVRIARGLNLPVEVVMGHDSTTFSNATQIDEDTFDDYFQPRCNMVVDALTIGYLRPNLIDSGVAPEIAAQIVVWYDAGDLIKQPDTEKNAIPALAAGLIGGKAGRRALGFSEDDAPSPLELLMRIGAQRGQISAQLTVALLAEIAAEAGVELPSAADLAPAIGSNLAASLQDTINEELLKQHMRSLNIDVTAIPLPAVTRALVAAAAPSPPNYGAQLVGIDSDLRTRLVVAANGAMNRALDHAGNMLRSKATSERALLKSVPARLRFATLGPTKAHAFVTNDEALSGAWDELERQFFAWGEGAQADALETASRVAGGFTIVERDAYKLRQAGDLAEAWAWLKGALTSLAEERMFDPDPAAPEFGEFDPTLKVPVGMIRQAIARAGGGSGLVTNDAGGAYITLADAGTRPAGGIGTGELLREAMRDHGVSVEGYEWTYGPAQRAQPFEPHMQLDGVQFVNFDDPVLSNTSGFPDGAYYLPGDHSGCICDVTPILIPAADAGVSADNGDEA